MDLRDRGHGDGIRIELVQLLCRGRPPCLAQDPFDPLELDRVASGVSGRLELGEQPRRRHGREIHAGSSADPIRASATLPLGAERASRIPTCDQRVDPREARRRSWPPEVRAGLTPASRPSRRLQLAELAPLQLAGRCPRQIVDERDLARDLVAGEALADVGPSSSSDTVAPGARARRTPRAAGRSPCPGRRTPRRRRPASWAISRSSTSCGKTFSPPDRIMSSSRPSMNRRPASSKCPTSPVLIIPSITSLPPPPV